VGAVGESLSRELRAGQAAGADASRELRAAIAAAADASSSETMICEMRKKGSKAASKKVF
jgi:L-asparaginase/Glu-tRNA(Gln) amidotransferase subunit D